MGNRAVETISTEIQEKIFPWLVVLLLVNGDKIALQTTNTGKHALLKEFGGSIGGLEFSYKETIGRMLDKYNISVERIVVDEVLDIKDSYRADMKLPALTGGVSVYYSSSSCPTSCSPCCCT